MARLKVAAAGNAEKNVNRIDGRFQAEELRLLRGFDTGRLQNSFYSNADPTGKVRDVNPNFNWRVEGATADDITVGPGMATAYGYDIISEQTVHFKLDNSSFGKNFYIYLEWDFSNPDEAIGKIEICNTKVTVAQGGKQILWRPHKDNLILNPNGIFQMIIAMISINEDGSISSIQDKGLSESDIWTYPIYAKNSGHAESAETAWYAEGKSDKYISQYLDEIFSRIEKLGFREGTVSLGSGISATQNRVTRQGNYVIGSIKGISGISIPSRDKFGAYTDTVSVGTLPTNFRPKELSYGGAVCPEKQEASHSSYVGPTRIEIATDGKITVISWYSGGREPVEVQEIHFGFEADPL